MSPAHRQIYSLTLRKVLAYMLELGIDEHALLAGTELNRAEIEDSYHLISAEQARTFYRNALACSQHNGLGLEIGWITGLSDTGPYGMVQVAARTVREALGESYRNQSFYYTLADWHIEEAGGLLLHTASTSEFDAELHRFIIERGLATIQAHAEELCGSDAKPVKVLLDYPRPAYHRRYQDIFACPVLFSQPTCELHHSADLLDREINTYDPQVKEVLASLRDNLQRKLSSGGDIISEVKLNMRREKDRFPSLEQVASRLAMSSRTLRRRLKDKNTSFQALLDAERQQVALDFLLTTDMNIQQIAEHCGFSDAQNFSQAFRRWQSMSPSDYRARNLN
ncbi:MAG: AraC family transcriptional regulator ligand-binding domain-containing protein [Halieaceae bacterium]